MLKLLLKKQFMELNVTYIQDRKTGKRRSLGGIIGFCALFLLVFLSVGVMFYGVGALLGEQLFPLGLDWLYLTIMSAIAVVFGVFGSVFNTYAGLYRAKDNELLFSLPIPPRLILLSRMAGVFAMSLLYSAMAWIPGVLAYWVKGNPSATAVVFGVLVIFVNSLFVTVLTCLLGWLVALIANRLKNKSIASALFTLGFIGIYYFCYFRFASVVQKIGANADAIGNFFSKWGNMLLLMGKSAAGQVVPMVIFTLVSLLLFALCYWVLSVTYIRIVTMRKGGKKAVYREKTAKGRNLDKALFVRERKHFFASSVYMLNTGLGVIMLPAVCVVGLIKREALLSMLGAMATQSPTFVAMVPAFLVGLIGMIISLDGVTVPSVSLEGKTLWILQSLPLEASKVLFAKRNWALTVNAIPAVVGAVGLSLLTDQPLDTTIAVLLVSLAFTWMSADIGLVLGVRKANVQWTSEVVPVKQSMAVLVNMFISWLTVLMAVGGYFLVYHFFAMSPLTYFVALAAVFVVVARLSERWLKDKGAAKFTEL